MLQIGDPFPLPTLGAAPVLRPAKRRGLGATETFCRSEPPLPFDCRKRQGSGGDDRSFRISAGSAQPPMQRARKDAGIKRM